MKSFAFVLIFYCLITKLEAQLAIGVQCSYDNFIFPNTQGIGYRGIATRPTKLPKIQLGASYTYSTAEREVLFSALAKETGILNTIPVISRYSIHRFFVFLDADPYSTTEKLGGLFFRFGVGFAYTDVEFESKPTMNANPDLGFDP